MQPEVYFVLYDPNAKRYLNHAGVGVVHARSAQPYMTKKAAERVRDGWWQNKRFKEVRPVRLLVGAAV